jgi:hypothetical protein
MIKRYLNVYWPNDTFVSDNYTKPSFLHFLFDELDYADDEQEFFIEMQEEPDSFLYEDLDNYGALFHQEHEFSYLNFERDSQHLLKVFDNDYPLLV